MPASYKTTLPFLQASLSLHSLSWCSTALLQHSGATLAHARHTHTGRDFWPFEPGLQGLDLITHLVVVIAHSWLLAAVQRACCAVACSLHPATSSELRTVWETQPLVAQQQSNIATGEQAPACKGPMPACRPDPAACQDDLVGRRSVHVLCTYKPPVAKHMMHQRKTAKHLASAALAVRPGSGRPLEAQWHR